MVEHCQTFANMFNEAIKKTPLAHIGQSIMIRLAKAVHEGQRDYHLSSPWHMANGPHRGRL